MFLFLLSVLDEQEKNKLERLYNHYKNLMMYIALDILKDKNLAEETVQDSMISLFKVINDIEEIDSKRTYGLVIVVVKRYALNKLKYEKRRKHDSADVLEYMVSDAKSIDDIVVDRITYEDILSHMKLINEDDRNIILLKYHFGYSYKEIANHMNIKEATARKRCERARKSILSKAVNRGRVHEKK